jgi:hypothetical protein
MAAGDITECASCGARVMLRKDGSCPSCNQGRVVLSIRQSPGREFGRTELKVWERQPKVEITERGVVAHDLRPASTLFMPARCVCCDGAGARQIPVPASTGNTVDLPSCPACDAHLRPHRWRGVVVACFVLPATAFFGWKLTDSAVMAWLFVVLLLVGVAFAVALDQKRRKPLPMWDAPRDGHCGPLWLFRVGINHTFISHNRSWLRDARDANAATLDVTVKDVPERSAGGDPHQ